MASPWAVRIETLGTRDSADCTDLVLDPRMQRALARVRELPITDAPRKSLPWWGQAGISFGVAIVAVCAVLGFAGVTTHPASAGAHQIVSLPDIEPLDRAPAKTNDAVGDSYDQLNAAVTALLSERQRLGDRLATTTQKLHDAETDLATRHAHDAALAAKAETLEKQLTIMRERADQLEQLTQKLALEQKTADPVAPPQITHRVMLASRDNMIDLLHLNFTNTTVAATGDSKTYAGALVDQGCTLNIQADSDHLFGVQMSAFLGKGAPRLVREANTLLIDRVLHAAVPDAFSDVSDALPAAVIQALTHPGKTTTVRAADTTDILADPAGNVTINIHPAD
jgi:hypothetical protein